MNLDDFRADLRRERQRAAARGEQYAVELDLDVVWDVGAPLPFLISDGGRAAVVFYQRVDDPDWDGSYAMVVNPSLEEAVPLGIIRFDGVLEVSLAG